MTRTLLQKSTCVRFLYEFQSCTLAVHLPLAALIYLLISSCRLIIWPLKPPTYNLRLRTAVVINVNGRDTVTKSFVIRGKSFRLFHCYALSDISAYLTRTVEMETMCVSVGCHSVRTVAVVRCTSYPPHNPWSWQAIFFGIYQSYAGRRRIHLFVLDKFCAGSMVKISKYRHCCQYCSGCL